MPRGISTAIALSALILGADLRAQTVKMSKSGICHAANSPWYEKTRNYRPFNSIESCLNEGGRLPRGYKVNVERKSSAQPSHTYRREYFGKGWDDADHDCQNTRAEVLIQLSTRPVTYRRDRGCTVDRGKWISPFTGKIFYQASELDVDHLVPLSLAWKRGANEWSEADRVTFANDLRNLWPVEASLNRSKGDKPISQWLPPTNQCEYVFRYIRMMNTYRLHITRNDLLVYRDCR